MYVGAQSLRLLADEQTARLQLTETVGALAEHTEQELLALKPEVKKAHTWLLSG